MFYFVRDEISFGLYHSHTKSSRTLRKRIGECTSKTDLHVALLRTTGILARLRYVRCRKEVLKNAISDFIHNRMESEVSHFWCECYLSGKWISCESLLDELLFRRVLKESVVARELISTIDWDGDTDPIITNAWDYPGFWAYTFCRRGMQGVNQE